MYHSGRGAEYPFLLRRVNARYRPFLFQFMRFSVILIMLVLLPIMVALHVWDYLENSQLRLVDQASAILKKHGVHGSTVDVRFLDLSVTGDAEDEASLEAASQELSVLGPLRLVSNRLSILARVRARLSQETLTIDGWMADQDTADSLRGLLLKREGGDRVMAKVLAAVPKSGLEAVLVAVELVLESGMHSAEHVLNVLARLNQQPLPARVETSLKLHEEPLADTARYDSLTGQEVSHV